ncbi:putative membrane protein SirB2 [Streptomyces sp. SAI-170]
MRYVGLGALIAVALAVAVSGVVELLTGWIHPWERARVLRLVPHGIGQVLTGSGLCCFFSLIAFVPSGNAFLSLMAAGAGLFLAGTVLVGVSRFP